VSPCTSLKTKWMVPIYYKEQARHTDPTAGQCSRGKADGLCNYTALNRLTLQSQLVCAGMEVLQGMNCSGRLVEFV
jgi:hypothetical protein